MARVGGREIERDAAARFGGSEPIAAGLTDLGRRHVRVGGRRQHA